MTPAPRSTERTNEVRMVLRSVTALVVVWLMVACRGVFCAKKLVCCQVAEACCLSIFK